MNIDLDGIHDAVQRDDVEAVKAFLDEGVDINARAANYSWVPLSLAAYSRRINIARLLFERGVHQTISQNDFGDALAFAACSNNEAFVQLFLEHGDQLLTTENLREALRRAACFSSHQTMRPLIQYGAVVTPRILFAAASAEVYSHEEDAERHPQTVGLVLDHGIDINAKDSEKNTALIMSAAYSRSLPTVKLLLARGARINVKNGRGKTALKMAMAGHHTEIVKFLVEAGAKP